MMRRAWSYCVARRRQQHGYNVRVVVITCIGRPEEEAWRSRLWDRSLQIPRRSGQRFIISSATTTASTNTAVDTTSSEEGEVVVSSRPPHQHSKKKALWKQTQQQADKILNNNQSNQQFGTGLVALQVKEFLIQMVNQEPKQKHWGKGPLADRLLQVALQDLERSKKAKENHEEVEDDSGRELRAKLYQLTIEAWLDTTVGSAASSRYNAAEKLLWEMLSNANEAKQHLRRNRFYCLHNLRANVENINEAFARVVFTFCKQGNPRLIETRVPPLVAAIRRLWDDPVIPLVPDSSAMDAILYYYYASKQQPAQVAHDLLQDIITQTTTTNHNNNNPFLKPTIHGINTVISAHAKEGNVEMAQQLIRQMLDDNPKLPQPQQVSFNGLLHAIAQRGGQAAGQHAEQVLEWMVQESLQPSTISYSTVIAAWSKSGHPEAAERSEASLRKLLELHYPNGKEAAVLFSMVVQAWSRSSGNHHNGIERARGVVDLFLTIYNNSNNDNDEEQRNVIMPKEEMTHVFNSLIMAFARRRGKGKATNKGIQKCLDQMQELGIPTDAVTHNSVMTALIQSGASERALEYFDKLLLETTTATAGDDMLKSTGRNQLDVLSYNIALDALSKCGRLDNRPKRALELLQSMNSGQTDVQATTATHNTVMKILAKSSLEDAAQRCEELMKAMEEQPASTGKPDVISYSTCIKAWGYSKLPTRFDRIAQLLQRMEQSLGEGPRPAVQNPNVIPYNTALIACLHGSSDERETALECMLSTLDRLRRARIDPNGNTYPLVFRCIVLNCRPGERRDSLLSKELEHSAKDGLICEQVLSIVQSTSPRLLRSCLPAEAFEEAGGNILFNIHKVPAEWRRNSTTNTRGKR